MVWEGAGWSDPISVRRPHEPGRTGFALLELILIFRAAVLVIVRSRRSDSTGARRDTAIR